MLTTTLPAVRHRQPLLYKMLYFAFAWLLAAVVLSIVVRDPGIERATGPIKIVPDMVYQRNERPVVTRVLIPWIIRGLSNLVPVDQAERLSDLARTQPFIAHNFNKYGWLPGYASVYFVAVAVLYFCLIGFFYSFRYFARGIFEGPRAFIDFSGLVALAAIPPLTAGLHTLYDFGTLFFMTACLGLMVRRHWRFCFQYSIIGRSSRFSSSAPSSGSSRPSSFILLPEFLMNGAFISNGIRYFYALPSIA